MGQQHDWAFGAGFEVIETEVLQNLTTRCSSSMSASGFNAAGSALRQRRNRRIIYQKRELTVNEDGGKTMSDDTADRLAIQDLIATLQRRGDADGRGRLGQHLGG